MHWEDFLKETLVTDTKLHNLDSQGALFGREPGIKSRQTIS